MNAASLGATSKGKMGLCSRNIDRLPNIYPFVLLAYWCIVQSHPLDRRTSPPATQPHAYLCSHTPAHTHTRTHTYTRPHMVCICADSAIFSAPNPCAYVRHECVKQTHICVRRKWLFTCRVHFANYVHSHAASHAWKTITYEDTHTHTRKRIRHEHIRACIFVLFIGKIQFDPSALSSARMLSVMAERRRSLLQKIRSVLLNRKKECPGATSVQWKHAKRCWIFRNVFKM